MERKGSRIAVIETDNDVIGFCKVVIKAESGKLDYLVVGKEFRGRGYGRALMDWTMDIFRQCGITHIEVRVVCGNPALRLYEKYGFKMKSYILGIEK